MTLTNSPPLPVLVLLLGAACVTVVAVDVWGLLTGRWKPWVG